MGKSEIFEKAVKINEEKLKQEEHEEMCKSAKICPECGNSISWVREEYEDKKGFLWFRNSGFKTGFRCSKCDWNSVSY